MTTAQKLNPTQRRLLNRAVKLKRLQWSCNGLCTDGRPHQYMPHPHARANQLVGSHPLTAFITGRGFGKTRAAAEWAKNRMSAEDGHRLAIVVPTFGYYRVTVEGESGMLALVPPSWGARWNVSKGELKFKNGSVAQVFGTDTQADAERLRGYQFHCFVAGTLIQTEHGAMPIEQVQPGERVWTRAGLRRVQAAGSRQAQVVERTIAGRRLIGTPEHRIWTENRGWVELSSIQDEDTIIVWTGDRTSTAGTTHTRTVRLSTATAGPGSRLTDPFPTGGRSTTLTATRPTTTWQTLSPSAQRIMHSCMRPSRGHWYAETVVLSSSGQDVGDQQPDALTATPSRSNGGSARPISSDPCGPSSAPSAGPSSVLARGRSARCDASTHGAGSTAVTVYDLSVEGHHEFFANGVLVHNSLWAEELCEWRHQQLAWDMAMFGLRLGDRPQTVVTTTPKPTPVIRELLARAEAADPLLSLRTGSTYDNFDNLPPEFQARIRTYEGSPRGSAEIHGRMLEDVEGALWQRAMIHYGGAHDGVPRLGEFVRIVVAIDPAGTHNPKSDETGLVVCGLAGDGRVWVLADSSGRYSPNGWATRAIGLYEDFEADAIVAETNFGAEMVETTLRSIDRNIRFIEVKATRGAGKQARAEPVVDLYQRGMVIHEQLFVELEDQMCQWVPGESRTSPDRLDAMVWGVTELVLKEQKPRRQMRFHA